MVTREAEWDAQTRGRALRLAEYEAGLCRCGCGQPMDEAHQPGAVYAVDEFTCRAGRAVEMHKRVEAKKAKDGEWPDGWDDGKHYYPRKPTAAELEAQPGPKPMKRPTQERKARHRGD